MPSHSRIHIMQAVTTDVMSCGSLLYAYISNCLNRTKDETDEHEFYYIVNV